MSSQKPEQLKQNPQAPINQSGKIQMNTKVNNEKPGSALKLPSTSRIKSPIRMNKQCNAQGSTKSLQRSYSIKSIDSDSDHIVASLHQEDIINNYKTWDHLSRFSQLTGTVECTGCISAEG